MHARARSRSGKPSLLLRCRELLAGDARMPEAQKRRIRALIMSLKRSPTATPRHEAAQTEYATADPSVNPFRDRMRKAGIR